MSVSVSEIFDDICNSSSTFEFSFHTASGEGPAVARSKTPLVCHSASIIAHFEPGGILIPKKTKRASAFAKSAAHSSASLSLALLKDFMTISMPLSGESVTFHSRACEHAIWKQR